MPTAPRFHDVPLAAAHLWTRHCWLLQNVMHMLLQQTLLHYAVAHMQPLQLPSDNTYRLDQLLSAAGELDVGPVELVPDQPADRRHTAADCSPAATHGISCGLQVATACKEVQCDGQGLCWGHRGAVGVLNGCLVLQGSPDVLQDEVEALPGDPEFRHPKLGVPPALLFWQAEGRVICAAGSLAALQLLSEQHWPRALPEMLWVVMVLPRACCCCCFCERLLQHSGTAWAAAAASSAEEQCWSCSGLRQAAACASHGDLELA